MIVCLFLFFFCLNSHSQTICNNNISVIVKYVVIIPSHRNALRVTFNLPNIDHKLDKAACWLNSNKTPSDLHSYKKNHKKNLNKMIRLVCFGCTNIVVIIKQKPPTIPYVNFKTNNNWNHCLNEYEMSVQWELNSLDVRSPDNKKFVCLNALDGEKCIAINR